MKLFFPHSNKGKYLDYNKKMKLKDYLFVLLIVSFYITYLFLLKPQIFSYKFDNTLIDRYFLSQDIPHEVSGKRLFLSDAEVDLATGYLYVTGKDPALYNFEHMPLIKYLYGFSVLVFNNPYPVTMILGILFLVLYFYFVKRCYHNSYVPLLACLLFITEPLFIDASSQTLFDLGQTTSLLLYLISIFYFKDNFVFQGIALGLFAAAKFWITPIFFVTLIFLYKMYKKELDAKKFFTHLVISFLVFALSYTQSFILTNGRFNLIWHILRIFKYRLQHNVSTFFGASIILFVTGYLQTWWGSKNFIRIDMWNILWPLSLIISLYVCIRNFLLRRINEEFLIAIMPFAYLLYLGVQAPFPRYFLIILPFLYMIVANQTYLFLRKQLRIGKIR